MANTFSGGIHFPTNKELTHARPIEHVEEPQYVVIPMRQHIGVPCTPLVKVGDYVHMGQKIGDSDAFMSVPVHASISGNVIDVSPRWHPSGDKVMSVVIENDFQDDLIADKQKNVKNVDKMTPDDIVAFAREMGLVGMGGAGFPTHVKLRTAIDRKVDTLLINGAECEPVIAADERAMIEYPKFIVGGIRMLMRALSLDEAFVGIETNKADAISTMKIIAEPYGIHIVPLKTKYPQGAEKQLIRAVTRREVKSGELPFDAGCAVFNIDTCASLYRCASGGLPVIKRVVTVSGPAVKSSKNALARIGTPMQYMFEAAGGFTAEPTKIIMGGPMMGIAQHTLEAPIIKQTNGLIAYTTNNVELVEDPVCIRCGRCVKGCPMHLMPNYINMYAKNEMYDEAEKYNVLDCIECGACSYSCPAKIQLVQMMRLTKFKVTSKKKREGDR